MHLLTATRTNTFLASTTSSDSGNQFSPLNKLSASAQYVTSVAFLQGRHFPRVCGRLSRDVLT